MITMLLSKLIFGISSDCVLVLLFLAHDKIEGKTKRRNEFSKKLWNFGLCWDKKTEGADSSRDVHLKDWIAGKWSSALELDNRSKHLSHINSDSTSEEDVFANERRRKKRFLGHYEPLDQWILGQKIEEISLKKTGEVSDQECQSIYHYFRAEQDNKLRHFQQWKSHDLRYLLSNVKKKHNRWRNFLQERQRKDYQVDGAQKGSGNWRWGIDRPYKK